MKKQVSVLMATLLLSHPILALADTTSTTSMSEEGSFYVSTEQEPNETSASFEEHVPFVEGSKETATSLLTDTTESDGQSSESQKIPVIQTINEEIKDWQFDRFGESASASKNSITYNPDSTVTISSTGNGGKIQTSGSDGISYYYTQVPKEKNFDLRATIHVDSWQMTNGQEGFGLMVRDNVPSLGSSAGSSAFTNSFSFLGTKFSTDGYTMKLGLGTRTVTGIFNNSPVAGSVKIANHSFESYAKDHELAGTTYNVLGNRSNPNAEEDLDQVVPGFEMLTTFDIRMQKTNTGFICTYYGPEGQILGQETMYDWEDLFIQEENHLSVGFLASRNMTITVSQMTMTYSNPAEDEAADERPITLITPEQKITSSQTTGTSSYDFTFTANADGVVSVRNTATMATLFENQPVVANEVFSYQLALNEGENPLEATFVPNPDFIPGEYQAMENSETQVLKQTVHYKEQVLNTIYVTPTGAATGDGTLAKPLDIQTAVNFAAPGQTIVLQGGTYAMTAPIQIPRSSHGTAEKPITLVAEKADQPAIFDFGQNSAGLIHWANYWNVRNIQVTNTKDMQKGIQISGSYNTFEDIETYRNGNTGLQISGLSTESPSLWPAHNQIKNSTSYYNADFGFEDADGFAAKLTVGEGNLFDGCIAYHNADDGWDLFAKNETGSIGAVTIKNSVAYGNGFIPGDPLEREGNGNGFKMGGSSLPGGHILENSLAFNNLAKGIDSNSAPDIKVFSSTSFNNGSYNVAFYTNSNTATAFLAQGILSFRSKGAPSVKEQLNFITQSESDVINDSNYYWNVEKAGTFNQSGVQIKEDAFQSLNTEEGIIGRYENGSINVNGLMALTKTAKESLNKAKDSQQPIQIGAFFDGNTSVASAYPVFEFAKDDEKPEDDETPKDSESTTESSSSEAATNTEDSTSTTDSSVTKDSTDTSDSSKTDATSEATKKENLPKTGDRVSILPILVGTILLGMTFIGMSYRWVKKRR